MKLTSVNGTEFELTDATATYYLPLSGIPVAMVKGIELEIDVETVEILREEFSAGMDAWEPEPEMVAPPKPTMYAFSFDLYADGNFLDNVVIHETDRVSAWCALAKRSGDYYDVAKLVASKEVVQ